MASTTCRTGTGSGLELRGGSRAQTDFEDAVVTYRWYIDEELVDEYAAPLDPGYNFSWVNSEEGFPPGEYRVDVLLGEGLVGSTGFRVLAP